MFLLTNGDAGCLIVDSRFQSDLVQFQELSASDDQGGREIIQGSMSPSAFTPYAADNKETQGNFHRRRRILHCMINYEHVLGMRTGLVWIQGTDVVVEKHSVHH